MGSFYANVTLVGTAIDAVAGEVDGPAFATEDGDSVVVFSAADDELAPSSGAALSAALGCPAVAAMVHDDDILAIEVFVAGASVASVTMPDMAEYFGDEVLEFGELDPASPGDVGAPPAGAAELVAAVGRGDVGAIRAAMDGDFVFATERHGAMVEALGLPRAAVGWGFRYLSTDRDGYRGTALVALGQ